MEATALSVLPNSKIPKEDLEAFYDYCKQNPKAKEAVDTVIKAFSPDSIGEFIKNCKQVPLPTDTVSFKEFCSEYKDQLRNVQEAPKQETVVANDKVVVVENNGEKQELAENRQKIHDILAS